MRTDRHAALGVDVNRGTQAPNKRPPGAIGLGPEDGTFFSEGQVPGELGGHFELAVDFGGIAVEAQFVDVGIGCIQSGDALSGEVGGESVLLVLMFALDFAFGLWGGSVAESDAVKVERLAQGGEGFGPGGEEKGVIVDVERQRQAVADEGLGEEIKVRQQDFLLIDFGAGKDTAAIVQEVEHGEELAGIGEVGMGRGIQLPELTETVALPAPDHPGSGAQAGGLGQVVLNGPAADLSAVDFELKTQQDLAGSKAIGRGRPTTEAGAQEGLNVRRPVGAVIAAGAVGLPELIAAGSGRQIVAVKLIEAAARKLQFGSGGAGGEFSGPEPS